MLARTWSAAIQGVDALTIEIEINATGLGNDTKVMVVVLPDAAVRESRERVWSALCTSDIAPPAGFTTTNLAPASMLPKVVCHGCRNWLSQILWLNNLQCHALPSSLPGHTICRDGG